jgi:hypothetical protein
MARQIEAGSRNQGQEFVALRARRQIDEAAWGRSEKVQHRSSPRVSTPTYDAMRFLDAALGMINVAALAPDRRNPFKGTLNVSY